VCRECIGGWAKAVLTGELEQPMARIRCPMDLEHVPLSYRVIAASVDAADIRRLDRACAREALGDACVICPRCDVLGVDEDRIGRVKCEGCGECFGESTGIQRVLESFKSIRSLVTNSSGVISSTATAAWKIAKTTPCPSCGVPIQKNGGCPSMQCSHCHTRFCWTCQQPTGHGHNCAFGVFNRLSTISAVLAIALSVLKLDVFAMSVWLAQLSLSGVYWGVHGIFVFLMGASVIMMAKCFRNHDGAKGLVWGVPTILALLTLQYTLSGWIVFLLEWCLSLTFKYAIPLLANMSMVNAQLRLKKRFLSIPHRAQLVNTIAVPLATYFYIRAWQ